MLSWLIANWQPIILGLIAIETVLARLFPNVGFFKILETDTEAVARATGVTPPKS